MLFTVRHGSLVCIAIAVLCLDHAIFSRNANGQEVDTVGPKTVLKLLRSRQPELALETIGKLVDEPLTTGDIAYSGLPSAAGGLYRLLSQSTADEQFELLERWTLPEADREPIRILSVPVSTEAPPKVFARSLGERTRDSSFAIASVGPVNGFFCSGWMLTTAADQIGRLTQFRAKLDQLSRDNVENAEELLMLSHLAGSRGDLDIVRAYLRSSIDEPPGKVELSPIDMTKAAIASASLLHDGLRPYAEELLSKLVDRCGSDKAVGLRPFLRIAHATAVQIHQGESSPEVLFQNSLRHWVTATVQTAKSIERGLPDTVWLSHEQHVMHLAGGTNDILFCRYPLMGQFEFVCETQEGGSMGTDGGMAYGGLHYQPLGRHDMLSVWDADCEHSVTRPSPFARHDHAPVFNRLSIRSAAGSTEFESNFHPVWFDDATSQASPWIGLRSSGTKRPVFRNLRINGTPTIPREVVMAKGNQLRGWQSGFFGETQPRLNTDSQETTETRFDWQIQSGEIVGSANDEQDDDSSQGLLQYQRPLLVGESIRYEFLHRGNQTVVHPAIGRLAFLLEPNGIRVRWITTGENEWTGLEADNTALEPLSRRGDGRLPFKSGEWNLILVELTEQDVMISVNNELVYQRPRQGQEANAFGLYRPTRSAECRVKNVVMNGDWPETLPEDLVANPLASKAGHLLPLEERTTQSLIGDEIIADNVLAVRREAATMTAEKRYEFLCRWILPSRHHAGFRVSGTYLPANIPPPVQQDPAFESNVTGIVSPVFDLLKTAAVLSKLPDLRRRVESAKPERSSDLNAFHALSALIDFELGQPESAVPSVNALTDALPNIDDHSILPIWPALLVVHRGIDAFPTLQAVPDLVASLHVKYGADNDSRLPQACLSDIHFLNAGLRDRRRAMPTDDKDINTLDHWISISPATASVRGDGNVTARWERNEPDTVTHLGGPDVDYLAFVSPLQGDYSMSAELSTHQLGQILNAGRFVGSDYQRDRIQTGELGGSLERVVMSEAFEKSGPWVTYRTEISDSNEKVFLNGRLVQQRQLTGGESPWLAFRTWYKTTAQIRHVELKGSPKISKQVSLSSSPELSGWDAYFSGSLRSDNASWKSLQADSGEIEIIGSARPDLAKSSCERLVRYFRPLNEDSSVAYEFYCDSNVACASPALDRLALVLTARGVAEHWVTDGRFDRTRLRPDNLQFIPKNQRHDGDFPLRQEAWNDVRIELQGDRIRLRLNDQLVYEREINDNNDRTFGLFHYADQGEVRVRRIALEGDWPIELPEHQQLADPLPNRLDESLPKLKSVFSHVFGDVNDTNRFFNAKTLRLNGDTFESSEGLSMSATSVGRWKQLAASPQFSMRGDFDVTASVTNIQLPESAEMSRVVLMVSLDDDRQRKLITAIAFTPKQGSSVMGSINMTYPDGTTRFLTDRQTDESTSGRLRVARRGEQVFFLFAPGETSLWRLIHRETASTADVPMGGIQLVNIAKGTGTTSAVWKNITIRAEEMMVAPQTEPVSTLSIIRVDGSEIHDLATPSDQMTHLGSPAWSPDGEQIAYDQHSGGTPTSRLMVIDRSGGEPVDIGFGSMPTFSPDGRQIAFSAAGQGVGIANADGSNRRILDPSGWGIQWSPVDDRLAYSKAGNLYLWGLKESTSISVLQGAAASRYSYIYWNMCWSPDGKQIALKGRRRDGSGDEIAVVALSKPTDLRVLVPNLKYGGGDLAWSPDSKRLVVPTLSGGSRGSQLHEIDLQTGGLKQLLPNQPSNRTILTAAWSADGQWLAIGGKYEPEQIPWVSGSGLRGQQ